MNDQMKYEGCAFGLIWLVCLVTVLYLLFQIVRFVL